MFTRDSVGRTNGFYIKYGKRAFDLVLSVPFFVLFSPIFLIIAISIKIESPGPVAFVHERIGLRGKTFKIYKFRTMVKDAPSLGTIVTQNNDPRITSTGKLLRKYKVDEMLQIINVIKGDMSLIGPRPEVKKYVKKFINDYKWILKIKPGMTDYAAIAFRNEEKILAEFNGLEEGYEKEILPKKIKLYKKYIEEMNLVTDVKIFFNTIWEILR